MKKLIFALFFISACAGLSAAARQFIEGTDYFTDFKQQDENMAAVVHITFISVQPTPAEAESVLKDQLKLYAQILATEKENAKKEKEEALALLEQTAAKDKKKSKTKYKANVKEMPKNAKDIKDPNELKAFFEDEDAQEEKYKNIIGSVRFTADGTPENTEKIKYSDDSSAFVWIGKTKKIVPFPDYIKFLKKEKEDRKQKEKERALMIKELSKVPQNNADEDGADPAQQQ